jgi:hypothetical protein
VTGYRSIADLTLEMIGPAPRRQKISRPCHIPWRCLVMTASTLTRMTLMTPRADIYTISPAIFKAWYALSVQVGESGLEKPLLELRPVDN